MRWLGDVGACAAASAAGDRVLTPSFFQFERTTKTHSCHWAGVIRWTAPVSKPGGGHTGPEGLGCGDFLVRLQQQTREQRLPRSLSRIIADQVLAQFDCDVMQDFVGRFSGRGQRSAG